MGGVPDQRASGPMPAARHRMAKQAPETDLAHAVQKRAHVRAKPGEGAAQLVGITGMTPTLVSPLRPLLHGHDVGQRAAAQRITDEMLAGAHMHLHRRART